MKLKEAKEIIENINGVKITTFGEDFRPWKQWGIKINLDGKLISIIKFLQNDNWVIESWDYLGDKQPRQYPLTKDGLINSIKEWM